MKMKNNLILVRLGFYIYIFLGERTPPSLFLFQEELIQHQYYFLQFLNKLFRVS